MYGDKISLKVREAVSAVGIPVPDFSIFDITIPENSGFKIHNLTTVINWREHIGKKVISMLSGNIDDQGSILYALDNLLKDSSSPLKINPAQCDLLLNYFAADLPTVKTVGNSIQILQRLPWYETILNDRSDLYNKYVYTIPNGIPKLTKETFHIPFGITFLHENKVLNDLYLYLGCKNLTVTEFYCQHMLPLLEKTSDDKERLEHLCFIRDSFQHLPEAEQKAMQSFFLTKCPKLFPNLAKELKAATELMDPFHNLLRLFHKKDADFPTPPYNDIKWHDFLIMAGLCHEILPTAILGYARQLSLSDLQNSYEVSEQAKVLLENVFDKYDQLEVG